MTCDSNCVWYPDGNWSRCTSCTMPLATTTTVVINVTSSTTARTTSSGTSAKRTTIATSTPPPTTTTAASPDNTTTSDMATPEPVDWCVERCPVPSNMTGLVHEQWDILAPDTLRFTCRPGSMLDPSGEQTPKLLDAFLDGPVAPLFDCLVPIERLKQNSIFRFTECCDGSSAPGIDLSNASRVVAVSEDNCTQALIQSMTVRAGPAAYAAALSAAPPLYSTVRPGVAPSLIRRKPLRFLIFPLPDATADALDAEVRACVVRVRGSMSTSMSTYAGSRP